MLWFSGVRGAMAFALSLKSRQDFHETGNSFLIVTLVITSLTLIYSSMLLDLVIRKCEIVANFENQGAESSDHQNGCFDRIKEITGDLNERYLLPLVHREHEDGDERLSDSKIKEKYLSHDSHRAKQIVVRNLDHDDYATDFVDKVIESTRKNNEWEMENKHTVKDSDCSLNSSRDIHHRTRESKAEIDPAEYEKKENSK